MWVRASTHPKTAHPSGNTGFPYGGFSRAATGNYGKCMLNDVSIM